MPSLRLRTFSAATVGSMDPSAQLKRWCNHVECTYVPSLRLRSQLAAHLDGSKRATKEMVQPCRMHLRAVSLIATVSLIAVAHLEGLEIRLLQVGEVGRQRGEPVLVAACRDCQGAGGGQLAAERKRGRRREERGANGAVAEAGAGAAAADAGGVAAAVAAAAAAAAVAAAAAAAAAAAGHTAASAAVAAIGAAVAAAAAAG